MDNMLTDIEGFLTAPLDAHENGLAAGIAAASAEIADRVASWSEGVAS